MAAVEHHLNVGVYRNRGILEPWLRYITFTACDLKVELS